MPRSQLVVVMLFQFCVYVVLPAGVGFAANVPNVEQPLRNGFVEVPPPSSVIVPSSGMSVLVTVAPLVVNCGEYVYVTVVLRVPEAGSTSVFTERLQSGTVLTVPS